MATTPTPVLVSSPSDYEDKVYLKVFHYASYLMPLFLLIGGYTVPAMRYVVFSGVPKEEMTQLLGALLLSVVLAFLWVVMDVFTTTNHRTPVTRLRENAAISWLIALLLSVLTAGLFTKGALGWWLVIPTITALVDAFITVDRGMENAAQKPITQVESARP